MTQQVRLVHAADLHLDAPFKGVDAADPRVRDALVASTFRALDALVAVCLENQVDFLVIAGDVYNVADTSLRAQFAFRDACTRLTDAGISVYLACGNHDPLSSGRRLSLPAGVHVFSSAEVERVVFEREDGLTCAIYGRSFAIGAEKSNLAARFRRDPSDHLAVGVLHTNVGGHAGHEPYAPCTLDDLRAAGMDYWALGHIHKSEGLDDRSSIVYAGCAQGLNPNESGPRGCRLVTLGEEGISSEFVPTCSVVWEQLSVDASDAEDAAELLEALAAGADRVAATTGGRPVILRLTITGRTPVHQTLGAPGALEQLRAELAASLVEREQWIWIDRIDDRTRPLVDLEVLRRGQDLAGDLVRLADAVSADDEGALRFVEEILLPIRSRLDPRDMPAVDPLTVLERARDLVLDRLLAAEDR